MVNRFSLWSAQSCHGASIRSPLIVKISIQAVAVLRLVQIYYVWEGHKGIFEEEDLVVFSPLRLFFILTLHDGSLDLSFGRIPLLSVYGRHWIKLMA